MALLPASAQDGGPGPRVTFGLSQTFSVDDNLGLDVDGEDTSSQANTGLSFGLSSQTGISSIALNATTALRILDGPDSDSTEFDLDGTQINLNYGRGAANSALNVTGSYTMQQIDTARTLADFGDVNAPGFGPGFGPGSGPGFGPGTDAGTGTDAGAGTGTDIGTAPPPGVDVPEDLGQLTGTGQRRTYGLNAGLSFGLQDPVGYQLNAGISGLDYSDTSDPDLFGNTRTSLGAAMLLQLSPVDQAQIGLTWGNFTSDDPENEDESNLNLAIGVTRALPNGTVAVSFFADNYDDEDEARVGFSLSRALELPAGALSGSIGATRLDGSDPEFTGALSWRQDLADGAFTLGATQAVQNDADNVAQYVTGLRVGYGYAINDLSQLGLNASFVRTEGATSDDRTEAASFGAVYSRALTEDWALDLGYTYRQREEDSDGMARSNAVFLGLRRAWELRP